MLPFRGRQTPEILEISIDGEHFAISSSAIREHFPSLWENSKKDIRKGRLYPKRHAYSTSLWDRDTLLDLFQVLENHDHRAILDPSDRNALMDLRYITRSSNHPVEQAHIFRSLAKLLRDDFFGCNIDMAFQISEEFLDDLPEIMMVGPGIWIDYVLALGFVWRGLQPNYMGIILEQVVAYGLDPLELREFRKRAKSPLRETMMSVLGYPPDLESHLDYPYSDYTHSRGGRRHRLRGQRLLGPIPEIHDPRAIHASHIDHHQGHHGGGHHQITSLYEDYPQRPRAKMP
ncbi:MAG: hypothetical protein Q9167_003613 [Letrouitia subvulpina]